jgi:hypothetical protein
MNKNEQELKLNASEYGQVCMTYILQMFNESTACSPADIIYHMISYHIFSSHVVEQVDDDCSHCISYRPIKFRQSGSQWWHVHSILDVPTKQNKKYMKGSKVRRTRWTSDRPAPANPFLQELSFSEARHFLVGMWRRSVLLQQHAIGTLFFQYRHKEFLYLRRHFNNCECSASGGKIWKFKWHKWKRKCVQLSFLCLSVHEKCYSKMVYISCVHSVF